MSDPYRQTTHARRSDGLSRLRYSLWLAPEGAILLACLILAEISKFPTLFSITGLVAAFWFIIRMLLIFNAKRALANANTKRAAQTAGFAAKMNPWSADTLALQGTIQLASNRPQQAVEAFTQAYNCFPLQPLLLVALSTAQLEAGESASAQASAERALALDLGCAAAYLAAATAARAAGAESRLIEDLLRAGLNHAQTPADRSNLQCELAEQLLTDDRVNEARLAIQQTEGLLVRCPARQQAGLHYRLGELLRQVGDLESARRHFNASERIDPSGPYAADAWRAARS